jgi:site-specific DNA-methyltransferase (adenine-specific)
MIEKYINKILNCDCLEGLKIIPHSSIQLTVTSPPYQKARDYKGYKFDFHKTAKELFRVTKDGGVIAWVIGDTVENKSLTLEPFEQALYFKKECGFLVHERIIYQKKNFSHPQKNRYHTVSEDVFIFSKGPPKIFNGIFDRKNLTAGAIGNLGVNTFTERDGSKSVRKKKITAEFGKRHNVWLGNTRGQEEMCVELKHPAMMPKWLARDLILSYSNPNDIILEPLLGSGTVGQMALNNGRNFLGFESAPEYCLDAQIWFKKLCDQEIEIVKL